MVYRHFCQTFFLVTILSLRWKEAGMQRHPMAGWRDGLSHAEDNRHTTSLRRRAQNQPQALVGVGYHSCFLYHADNDLSFARTPRSFNMQHAARRRWLSLTIPHSCPRHHHPSLARAPPRIAPRCAARLLDVSLPPAQRGDKTCRHSLFSITLFGRSALPTPVYGSAQRRLAAGNNSTLNTCPHI